MQSSRGQQAIDRRERFVESDSTPALADLGRHREDVVLGSAFEAPEPAVERTSRGLVAPWISSMPCRISPTTSTLRKSASSSSVANQRRTLGWQRSRLRTSDTMSCRADTPSQANSPGLCGRTFEGCIIATLGHLHEVRFESQPLLAARGEDRRPQNPAVFFFHRHAMARRPAAKPRHNRLFDPPDHELRHGGRVIAVIARVKRAAAVGVASRSPATPSVPKPSTADAVRFTGNGPPRRRASPAARARRGRARPAVPIAPSCRALQTNRRLVTSAPAA